MRKASISVTLALVPLLLVLGILVASVTPSAAQDASLDDRLREVLRKMTIDLRTAQDNQAALQAQLDQAQKQRDVLQQQVASLNAKLSQQPAAPASGASPEASSGAPATPPAATAPELQQLHDVITALKQQNAALQDGLSHWQTAYQQAAGVAQQKDAESRQLSVTTKSATGTLDVCEAKNTKLIAVANDILHLYRTQSFRTLLLGSYEPLLGYKEVELQNVIQDNEDRIRAQQYYPGEQPPPQPVTQAATGSARAETAASSPPPQKGRSK